MKKLSLLFLSVLTFVACSNQKTDTATAPEAAKLDGQSLMPIAVVNVDSILSQYTFAQKARRFTRQYQHQSTSITK